MTSRQKTIRFDDFKGLKLKEDPYGLKKGDLVKAENIDITDAGKVRRRGGFTFEREVANRKIWGGNGLLLSVEGSNLISLNASLTPTTIRSDLHPTEVLDFCEVGTDIYYSGLFVNGKFTDGVHTDWEVEAPSGMPVFTAGLGGLYEGCYHFAMTYEHSDGRESGCGKSVKTSVTAGQSISLSSIPQPSDADIAYIRLYLSEANSETLRLYAKIAVGTTSLNMTSRRRGDELTTQYLRPPPKGQYIGFCASRMLVAAGSALFFSRPFSYHLFDLTTDYISLSADINMVATTANGAFLSAGKTYYLDLGGEYPTIREISAAKAITGSLSYTNAQDIGTGNAEGIVPVWVSEEGIVYGTVEGRISNLSEGAIGIGQANNGATLPRDDNGITQIISTVRGSENQNMFIGDTVTATVRKREVVEGFNFIGPDGEAVVDGNGEPIIYEE